jgi:hypothetical protein
VAIDLTFIMHQHAALGDVVDVVELNVEVVDELGGPALGDRDELGRPLERADLVAWPELIGADELVSRLGPERVVRRAADGLADAGDM